MGKIFDKIMEVANDDEFIKWQYVKTDSGVEMCKIKFGKSNVWWAEGPDELLAQLGKKQIEEEKDVELLE